jgi:hypothetical protein
MKSASKFGGVFLYWKCLEAKDTFKSYQNLATDSSVFRNEDFKTITLRFVNLPEAIFVPW